MIELYFRRLTSYQTLLNLVVTCFSIRITINSVTDVGMEVIALR